MLDRFKDAQWMVEKRELQVDGGDTSPGSHGSVTHLVWDTVSPDDWTNVIAHIVEDRIPGIAEANARLIAAAVDLLAVAQRVVAMEPGSAMSTLYAAQAAIAKAEGRE